MPLKNRSLIAIALLVLIIGTTACGGDAAPAAQNDPAQNELVPTTVIPTATPDVQPTPTEALAATVNGQLITLAAFQAEADRQAAQLAALGLMPADRAVFEASVLTAMIDQMLIEQAAEVQGITVSEEEVEAEIALNIDLAGGEDAWQAWLAENYLDPVSYRTSIRSALVTTKIRDEVIAGVPEAVPQVHARHILVATEAEAQSLKDQLDAGADFAELAFTYSQDNSTRELGGDLGWFTQEQLTQPVIAETAFALQPGEISGPIASRLGYHLVQTLERVEDRPLDEAARATLFELTFERWRQSLWDRADVQRFIGG